MIDLERRNRRVARAEIQLQELAQIPNGYQPQEQEKAVFQELAAKIIAVFGRLDTEPGQGKAGDRKNKGA